MSLEKEFEKCAKHLQCEGKSQNDALLGCLLLLARFHQRSHSASALLDGVPLATQHLTLAEFPKVAARASLKTSIIETDLSNITTNQLPVIVILEDNNALVLTNIEQDRCTLFYGTQKFAKITMPLAELQRRFSGQLILLKPCYCIADRSRQWYMDSQHHWFWQSIMQQWPVYRKVLLASLLINIFILTIPLFIMNVYDRVIPNGAMETLWALAIGVFLAFIFDFILKSLRAYFIDICAKKINVEVSNHVFENIMAIRLANRPLSIGVLANSIGAFDVFRDFITSVSLTTLVDLPFALLFIVIIGLIRRFGLVITHQQTCNLRHGC